MDPMTWGLIISGLGSALGGMFGGSDAPEGTNMGSFEGAGALDPRSMLGAGVGAIQNLSGPLGEILGRGVDFSGLTVQGLPSFSGGGLPMDIGAPAMDPAIANPGMLKLPGIKLGGQDGGVLPQMSPFSFASSQYGGANAPHQPSMQGNPIPPEKYTGGRGIPRHNTNLNYSDAQDALDAFDLLDLPRNRGRGY